MSDPRPCVGCLGTHECWVCSGTGFLHPVARRGLCERCGGTGVCELCAEAGAPAPADADLPGIPAPRATPAPTAQP